MGGKEEVVEFERVVWLRAERVDGEVGAVGAEDCCRRCGCRNARRKGVDLVDLNAVAVWRVAACCWMQRRQICESRMRFALALRRRRSGERIGVAMPRLTQRWMEVVNGE